MLISTNLEIYSQDTLRKDSLCFTLEESKIILKDLARLKYLDSTVVRLDTIIYNYVQLDSLRVDRIEDYTIEVKELTKDKNKALKKLRRNRKLFFVAGFVAILELFILIVR